MTTRDESRDYLVDESKMFCYVIFGDISYYWPIRKLETKCETRVLSKVVICICP